VRRGQVGRGRAAWGARAGQVGEDGLHGEWILHGGDDPQPAATARAGEDIEVEHGTQWNRLSEDKFWRRYNCVRLTGNGQPPRGVRRLARRLHEEYKIPVYVLVDNDPWGYYIYSVVKQESINLAFESERMTIPKAKFIGLSSADPDAYGLPRNVGIKLNDKDIGRARKLLKYRWFQKKPWQEEIKRMLASGLTYELDALANKDFRYLTKTYLPRKLKEEDWLD